MGSLAFRTHRGACGDGGSVPCPSVQAASRCVALNRAFDADGSVVLFGLVYGATWMEIPWLLWDEAFRFLMSKAILRV